MAKNNVADLLSVGSLFTTQAERDEAHMAKDGSLLFNTGTGRM